LSGGGGTRNHAGVLSRVDSYAVRYATEGLPVFRIQEASPHYPWSIAWRDGRIPSATGDFLEIAQDTGTARGWRDFDIVSESPPWLPLDDPVALELGIEPGFQNSGVSGYPT
jgi:hypothetical protein